MRRLIQWLTLVLLIPATGAHAASFYKWQDANGQWHFSDQQPQGIAAQRGQIEATAPTAAKSGDVAPSARTSAPHAAREKVVMYSAAWCGYCKKARAFLRKNRVPFSEYDVETSAKGKRDYQKYGASGVPIILVGKQRVQGFDQAALTRLLDL